MKLGIGRVRAKMDASLPVRGAWIEIPILQPLYNMIKSLPVRGAWIEIGVEACVHAFIGVAPRKGSVD